MRDRLGFAQNHGGAGDAPADNGRVYFGKQHRLFEIRNRRTPHCRRKNCLAVAGFLEKVTREYRRSGRRSCSRPRLRRYWKGALPACAPVADEAGLILRQRRALGESVVFCDPTPALLGQLDRESLYYRTDHHWTTRGAFLAYQALLTAQGRDAAGRTGFPDRDRIGGFFRHPLLKANLPLIPADTIEAYLPEEENPCTVTYDGGKTVRGSLFTTPRIWRDGTNTPISSAGIIR